MRRKAFLASVALALLASFGAAGAWAKAPFGFFNGLANGGNAGNGVEGVQGWALADTGVFAVDIVVDGVIVGRSNYGRSRPTVAKEFPGFPDTAAAGFGYQLDTTQFLNGQHTVTARVESRSGEVTYLNPVSLQFTNTTLDLLPFGKIEFPNQGAEMFGECNEALDDRRPLLSVVSGYALDVNANYNLPGIGYVELLIDGALTFNSQTDCTFSAAAGGLTECYGIRRQDVEQNFPRLVDAPHAGYRFVLDVGAEVGSGLYTQGTHELTIRAGDTQGNVTDVSRIEVTFTCADNTTEDLAIGAIDFPVTGLLYGGIVQVSGWAVDLDGVAAVLVFVDGNLVAISESFIPRPDILDDYPSYAGSTPGWFTYIDTTQLSNGIHQLSAQVIDNNNVTTFIGKRPFTVENPIP